MTYLEAAYSEALMLPPSPARDAQIDLIVRLVRWQEMRRGGHFHDVYSTCHMLICEPYGAEELYAIPSAPVK